MAVSPSIGIVVSICILALAPLVAGGIEFSVFKMFRDDAVKADFRL
jgi:hypothetical protein